MAGELDLLSSLTGVAAAANPYTALAGPAIGLLKTGYGIAQNIKANKMAKANIRPTYSIPTEISQNLSDAQRMALEGLPDEQKQQFVNNVERSQQFGLQQASTRKAGIAGLGATVQAGNDAYNQLLSQDAQARQRNQQALFNARGTMASAKNTAFNINEMQPYEDRAASARALKGAGLQNIYGGLSDVSQGALRFPGFDKKQGLGGAPANTPNAPSSAQYGGMGAAPITTPPLSGLGQEVDLYGGGYKSATPNWMGGLGS